MLIFCAQGQITLKSIVGFWQKFELIQVFMHVLITCKNEEDPMKNEFAGVATTFLPL